MCTACSCGTDNAETAQGAAISQVAEPTAASGKAAAYTVTGMTCGHCVASVTEEVSAIDGVRYVVVDLASGKLTFNSDEPVSPDAVEAAIREAGYALA